MLNRFFGKYGKQIAQCALIVGIISSQGAWSKGDGND